MKAYLKKYGVWEIVINTAAPFNKKSKAANQKEAKKNNTTTLKFWLDGLPSSIRESLGEFTSARELWLKLEADYQGKLQGKQVEDKHEREPNPIYGEVDKSLVEDERKLLKVSENVERELQEIVKCAKKVFSGLLISEIRIREDEFCKVKDQVVDSLEKHQQRTKGLKDLLKRLKDENTHLLVQLGEKDEEIDRLKDEVSQQEGDLRTQLEEARRKEEILKDQLDEKDKAYQMLETEVVELRKKAEQSEAHEKFKRSSSILNEILEC